MMPNTAKDRNSENVMTDETNKNGPEAAAPEEFETAAEPQAAEKPEADASTTAPDPLELARAESANCATNIFALLRRWTICAGAPNVM